MKLLLCLLPLVASRITIDIRASKTMHESDVTLSGLSRNVITPQEQSIFKLDEKVVQTGVLQLTGPSKRPPSNVYLKSPTPWNDLYKKNDWSQVATVTKPMKASIMNVFGQEVILNQKDAANTGTLPTQNVALAAKLENQFKTYWEQDTNKEIHADIDYNFSFKGIGNVTKLNLSSDWSSELREKVVGFVSKSTPVHLKPNENVTVVLSATRLTVTIKVEYVTILDGIVAANNEEPLNGHHFYGYDIGSVMKEANRPESITTSEEIVVQFYNDLSTAQRPAVRGAPPP